MRLPLVVFSLVLLLVQLIKTVSEGLPGERAHTVSDGGESMLMARIFQDAIPVYLFLGTLALTMIAFGKPTLLAQYGAWAVIVLQVVRSLAIWKDTVRLRWIVGILILLDLIVLWVVQLPFFDPLPG